MTDLSLHATQDGVDASLRRTLSQDVRRLVTGRMTNDEFDDVYYETYASSRDRTVSEVARFCYCLYSSDLLLPYRLRGRYAVSDEKRRAAVWCVLFLRSGRTYEWPPTPDNPILEVLAGLAMFLGVPLGVAFSLCWLQIANHGWDHFVGPIAVLGPFILAASLGCCMRWPELTAGDWSTYQQAGDYEVWPFLRSQDFDDAKKSCKFFSGG